MKKFVSLSLAAAIAVMLGSAAEAASPQTPTPATGAAMSLRTANTAMVVSHATAHLRKSPNTKSPILATLKRGTKIEVIGKVAGGKWAHVRVNKHEGYIALSLLKAA